MSRAPDWRRRSPAVPTANQEERLTGGDLVPGRVGHLEISDSRSPLDDFRERHQHLRVAFALISVRVVLVLPEADSTAMVPLGRTNAISSWKRSCFRRSGMTSFSIKSTNADALSGFNCIRTVRANIPTPFPSLRWACSRTTDLAPTIPAREARTTHVRTNIGDLTTLCQLVFVRNICD